MRAFVGFCISAVILINLVYAGLALWHQVRVFNRTREVYEPIADRIRTFEPGDDDDKAYVRCMVERPLDLQWSYSLPKGKDLVLIQQNLGVRSTNRVGMVGGNGRIEASCRWLIRVNPESSSFYIHAESAGGSSGTYGHQLSRILADHWDRLEIQIAGRDGLEEIDASRVITLLRIDFPEEVRLEVEGQYSEALAGMLNKPILVCIGEKGSKDWDSLPLEDPIRKRTR